MSQRFISYARILILHIKLHHGSTFQIEILAKPLKALPPAAVSKWFAIAATDRVTLPVSAPTLPMKKVNMNVNKYNSITSLYSLSTLIVTL